jgi:hypothetical protein
MNNTQAMDSGGWGSRGGGWGSRGGWWGVPQRAPNFYVAGPLSPRERAAFVAWCTAHTTVTVFDTKGRVIGGNWTP